MKEDRYVSKIDDSRFCCTFLPDVGNKCNSDRGFWKQQYAEKTPCKNLIIHIDSWLDLKHGDSVSTGQYPVFTTVIFHKTHKLR